MLSTLLLFVSTMAMMLTLAFLTDKPVLSGVITFITIITAYTLITVYLNKKRNGLLEDSCDPDAFLKATEKLLSKAGKKPKFKALIDINLAAGLIVKGDLTAARDLLDSIDLSLLSLKNGTLFTFYLNRITCAYLMGEMELAEELFETKVPLLAPVSSKMLLSTEMLIAERFFYTKKYNESQERLLKLLQRKTSRRLRVEIYFLLARIDEELGNSSAAAEKYEKVAKYGGQTAVALKARTILQKA